MSGTGIGIGRDRLLRLQEELLKMTPEELRKPPMREAKELLPDVAASFEKSYMAEPSVYSRSVWS